MNRSLLGFFLGLIPSRQRGVGKIKLSILNSFFSKTQAVKGAVCTDNTVTNAVQTTVGVTRVQRTRETVTAVLMAGWDQSVRPVRQTQGKKSLFIP